MSRETLTITDNRTGKSYEVPITNGTIQGHGPAPDQESTPTTSG